MFYNERKDEAYADLTSWLGYLWPNEVEGPDARTPMDFAHAVYQLDKQHPEWGFTDYYSRAERTFDRLGYRGMIYDLDDKLIEQTFLEEAAVLLFMLVRSDKWGNWFGDGSFYTQFVNDGSFLKYLKHVKRLDMQKAGKELQQIEIRTWKDRVVVNLLDGTQVKNGTMKPLTPGQLQQLKNQIEEVRPEFWIGTSVEPFKAWSVGLTYTDGQQVIIPGGQAQPVGFRDLLEVMLDD